MFTGFDFELIWQSLPYLFLDGMAFTLRLTVLAAAGGIVLGTLIAMMRLSHFAPLSVVAAGYVNLVRSLPLVLVIFWFYFLIPWVWQWVTSAPRPVPVGAFLSALITFMIFEAAYYAEIMRAGIQSVRKGQMGAGSARGMSYRQARAYVARPPACRHMA